MPTYFFPSITTYPKTFNMLLTVSFCVYNLLTAQLTNPQHDTTITRLWVLRPFLFPLWIIFCVSSVSLIPPMWLFLCIITVPYITYVSEIFATLLHPKVNCHAWLKLVELCLICDIRPDSPNSQRLSTTDPLIGCYTEQLTVSLLYAMGQLTFPS